jgi:hypothetical protein
MRLSGACGWLYANAPAELRLGLIWYAVALVIFVAAAVAFSCS